VATIKVFLDNEYIANLTLDSNLNYSFKYLDSYSGFDISPNITKKDSATSNTIKNFLQNLLPEGRALEDILNFTHISKDNIFALINELGFESSGALKFVNSNNNEPIFREIKESELISRIEQIEQKSIAIWDSKPRLSLAGVQDKLAVVIKDGKLGLANGSLSSTHILKFQTLRFSNIVLNEYFCMNLSKSCGISSANCKIKRYSNYLVLEVERFDRVVTKGSIKRLHIIDANQLLDLAPLYKYERAFGKGRDVANIREGVSFKKLFKVANSLKVPAISKLKILDWALFNLIIGNSDAHGKNISFFVTSSGIEIAPFYDILSTIIYKDIEHDLAMAFGDEFNINSVLGYDLVEFANSIGLPKQLVSNRLSAVAKAVIDNIDINLELNNKEQEFIDSLKELIVKRAKKYLDISKEMLKVSY
jgi:serine/threonine-protein kinase HipA